MKKLILLSILLFGCLTNYAQINPQYYEHSFYKVTFHKPLIGWMVRDTRKIKDNDNKIVYTIITANGNEHVYTEKRALSDIPDSTYYLTEEPITLKYKTSQKIGLDLLFDDNSIEANDAWEHKFTEGKYKSYGIDQFGDFEYGWDNVDGDYGIFHCTTKISYEIFRCECRDAGDTLCSGTELNCKYNFELPFNSSVYFAKKNNPKTKYLLKKIAQGQTEFTVSTKDITDSIGYNEPFDLYIFAGSGDFDFFKLNLGITHFGKIIEEVPYHRDDIYIKDNQLVIKNSQQYKNCNFVFEGKTVSKNYKAINDNHKPQFIPTGQYQLQISDKNDNYCQVNLDAYVPEIKYNYLDKKIDEFTHWHNEDTTQAINLKIYNVNKSIHNSKYKV